MDSNTHNFSEEEIKFEVERLRKEALEKKVKEELSKKETKEKELEDEMKNFLVKFFDDNGVILRKDSKQLWLFGNKIEDLFWEKLETYGGFSKCPACNSTPLIINLFPNGRFQLYRDFAIVSKRNKSVYISSFGESIKSIQCCEHLFDFHQKKRYIKLNKTPFKDNKFIEITKYVSKNIIDNESTIYTVTRKYIQENLQYELNYDPKGLDKYLNWDEYIPYVKTDLVEIPKQEDEDTKARSIAISKQRKEIEILERLLSEAKEKLKVLQN
jgi:hypothetical protein